MNNCINCIHNAVCDMASRFVEAFADNNGICTDFKDKSLLIERKALRKKVEELLIGHGYINPDTAIIECLEIIENFPTADVESKRSVKTNDILHPRCGYNSHIIYSRVFNSKVGGTTVKPTCKECRRTNRR